MSGIENPAAVADHDSSNSDILDMRDEEGWQDVEADEVEEHFVSLFDGKTFPNITDMLTYCKDVHSVDVWQLQRQFNLDFLGLVKLVNYIREQVKRGVQHPDVSSQSTFDQDVYLLPVLEDDAVLYSLEEVIQAPSNPIQNEVEELREQLASLQSQFTAYREDVQKYLSDDFKVTDKDTTSLPVIKESDLLHTTYGGFDDGYFKSYSYNAIHESMLKDTIRTDAYRDFIYENKDIFKDKIVMDVGCGTGILSMFCAKAGAKQVYAVDNSDIIEKAQQNVVNNGLGDKITCIRGKVEEILLPTDKVDVIVSEWMGYCLLYESMLDSVIYARDKYLAEDGLMAPSHVTIELAPLADSDLRISYIDFWKDVYGFNMTSMLEKAEEEVLTRIVESKELASDSARVLELDLHTAKVEDLDFTNPFKVGIREDFEKLEGFVLWFDTYFMRTRSAGISSGTSVLTAQSAGATAFSTGPATQPTHWQQGVCLIKDPGTKLARGSTIEGQITYKKQAVAHRSLDIDIAWEVPGSDRKSQTWRVE